MRWISTISRKASSVSFGNIAGEIAPRVVHEDVERAPTEACGPRRCRVGRGTVADVEDLAVGRSTGFHDLLGDLAGGAGDHIGHEHRGPRLREGHATAAPMPPPCAGDERGAPSSEKTSSAGISSSGQAQHVRAQVVEHHLLLRAGAIFSRPGLPEVAGDVVLLGVAHAAVRLQSAVGRLEPGVGAQVLRGVRLAPTRLALVVRATWPCAASTPRRRGRASESASGNCRPWFIPIGPAEHLALVAVASLPRPARRGRARAPRQRQHPFRVEPVEDVGEARCPPRRPVATGIIRSSMNSSFDVTALRPIFGIGRISTSSGRGR
jgi:hypothetical protein